MCTALIEYSTHVNIPMKYSIHAHSSNGLQHSSAQLKWNTALMRTALMEDSTHLYTALLRALTAYHIVTFHGVHVCMCIKAVQCTVIA